MTESIIAIAGLIVIAAITPGPNNIIVMSTAARNGLISTVPVIAGVITGGLLLVSLLWAGGSTIFKLLPWLRDALLYFGVVYLIWMSVSLMMETRNDNVSKTEPSALKMSRGFTGMVTFQFLNPKSWVLATVSISTASATMDGYHSLLILLFLFIFIPMACLAIWALGGTLIAETLENPSSFKWLNRVMALLLAGSALALI